MARKKQKPTEYHLVRVNWRNLTTNQRESHLVAISESLKSFRVRCEREAVNAEISIYISREIDEKDYRKAKNKGLKAALKGRFITGRDIVSNALKRDFLSLNQYDEIRLPKRDQSNIYSASGVSVENPGFQGLKYQPGIKI